MVDNGQLGILRRRTEVWTSFMMAATLLRRVKAKKMNLSWKG
jgi:hypothetical protein